MTAQEGDEGGGPGAWVGYKYIGAASSARGVVMRWLGGRTAVVCMTARPSPIRELSRYGINFGRIYVNVHVGDVLTEHQKGEAAEAVAAEQPELGPVLGPNSRPVSSGNGSASKTTPL